MVLDLGSQKSDVGHVGLLWGVPAVIALHRASLKFSLNGYQYSILVPFS